MKSLRLFIFCVQICNANYNYDDKPSENVHFSDSRPVVCAEVLAVMSKKFTNMERNLAVSRFEDN
uniref:Uncharacterized protein n=1 Tax=Romanomermis culicivorax TaxID=13658 RepID=A0A915HH16_ROMCU